MRSIASIAAVLLLGACSASVETSRTVETTTGLESKAVSALAAMGTSDGVPPVQVGQHTVDVRVMEVSAPVDALERALADKAPLNAIAGDAAHLFTVAPSRLTNEDLTRALTATGALRVIFSSGLTGVRGEPMPLSLTNSTCYLVKITRTLPDGTEEDVSPCRTGEPTANLSATFLVERTEAGRSLTVDVASVMVTGTVKTTKRFIDTLTVQDGETALIVIPGTEPTAAPHPLGQSLLLGGDTPKPHSLVLAFNVRDLPRQP